jgi:hypothetical protein
MRKQSGAKRDKRTNGFFRPFTGTSPLRPRKRRGQKRMERRAPRENARSRKTLASMGKIDRPAHETGPEKIIGECDEARLSRQGVARF